MWTRLPAAPRNYGRLFHDTDPRARVAGRAFRVRDRVLGDRGLRSWPAAAGRYHPAYDGISNVPANARWLCATQRQCAFGDARGVRRLHGWRWRHVLDRASIWIEHY